MSSNQNETPIEYVEQPSNDDDDDISDSLTSENNFVKTLINTIPARYYFDQDTKVQLDECKHSITNVKLSGIRGKAFKPNTKNKFSKLDPDQNKSVTELITQLDENGNNSGMQQQKSFAVESIDDLKSKFSDKMKEIRNGKMQGLPDSDVSEAQLLKRNKRRMNRQRSKEKKNEASNSNKPKPKHSKVDRSRPNSSGPSAVKVAVNSKPIFNKEGRMVFSKFDFAGDISSKKKVNLSGKDYKGILEKLNKKKEKVKKVSSENAEKGQQLERKEAWKTALNRAQGIKVKDDPDLLKKSIKKQEQKKRKSEKQWKNRETTIAKQKGEKQDKRLGNINKRIKDKKMNKIKKAVKKGRMIPGFS